MKKLLSVLFLLTLKISFLFSQELQTGSMRITSPLNRMILQQSSSGNADLSIFAEWLNSGDNIRNAAIRFQYKISTMDKDGNIGGALPNHDWTFGNFENLDRYYSAGSDENYLKVLRHPSGTINLPKGWYYLEVRVLRSVFLGWRRLAYSSVRFGVGDVYVIYGQSNSSGYGGNDEPNLVSSTTSLDYTQRDAVSAISRDIDNFTFKLKGFPIINGDNSGNILFDGFRKLEKTNQAGRIYPAGGYSWCWAPLGDKLLLKNNSPVLFLNAAIPGANIDFLKDTNSWGYKRFRHTLQLYANVTGTRGILWHQGENDARNQLFGTLDFSSYTEKLKSLIEQSRNDLNTNNLTWNIARASYYAFPDQSISLNENYGDPFAIHNSVPPNNIPNPTVQHSFITGNNIQTPPNHKDFQDYNKSLTDAQEDIMNQGLPNVQLSISTDDLGLNKRGNHRAIHFNGSTLSEVAEKLKNTNIDTGTPVDTKPVRKFQSITKVGSNYELYAPSGFDKYFWVLNDNGIYNSVSQSQNLSVPINVSDYRAYTCYLGKSNGQAVGDAINGWNLDFEMTHSFLVPGYQGAKVLAVSTNQITFENVTAQQTFSVMASNTYWTATESENWLTIFPSDNTSGNDGTTPIIVQVDENTTPNVRIGYIYVTEDGGGLSQTITIYQNPFNPCPNSQVLTNLIDDIYGTSTKRAIISIDANNQIFNGANVEYKSGNYILLQAGFKVEDGAVFKATIPNDPCNN